MDNETVPAMPIDPAPRPAAVPPPPVQDPPAAPQPAAAAIAPISQPRRAPSARLMNALLGGALVLAVAGIGFAAGRFTAPSLAGFRSEALGNGPGGGIQLNPGDGKGGQGGPISIGGSGGPSIEGTVESVTDTTLTVKTKDGQTIQIALDDSTTYHAQTDASSDDVATGGKVLVRLNFRAPNGGNVSGPSASDVTVVP